MKTRAATIKNTVLGYKTVGDSGVYGHMDAGTLVVVVKNSDGTYAIKDNLNYEAFGISYGDLDFGARVGK